MPLQNPALPEGASLPPAPVAAAGRWVLTPARHALLLCAVFLLAMLFRSPGLLLEPRMWGEEGALYYAQLQLPGHSPWTLVVRGSYQVLVNLAAGIGLLLPAAKVAHATTYVGLLAALATVALLGLLAAERGWRPWTTCLAVAGIAFLPQGYAVYLNSTNVQWVASMSVLLLALLKLEDWTPRARGWAMAWLVVLAASGVPAVTLAPVMLARGVLTRSRPHLVMAAILGLGAVVQIGLILTHPVLGREFELDPFLTVLGVAAQAVVGPLVGARWAELYVAYMFLSESALLLVLLVAVAILLGWVMVKGAVAAPGGRLFVGLLGAAAVLSVVVNVFGGLGVQVTAWTSGRYFILAATCWVLLVCAAANGPRPALRRVGLVCLVLLAAAGAGEVLYGTWKDYMLNDVPWQRMVEGCEGKRPCVVQAWPSGAGWQFMLFRP